LLVIADITSRLICEYVGEVSAILKDDFVPDIYQVDSDLGSIRLLEI
jgi:hypothetical protein